MSREHRHPSATIPLTRIAGMLCLGICCFAGPCLASSSKESNPILVPKVERFYFSGTFEYYMVRPVRLILKRTDSKSNTFVALWKAYWPDKNNKGDNKGDDWLDYSGTMTLDPSTKSVTGRSRNHNVTGTYTGTLPNVSFDLQYTGGIDGQQGRTLKRVLNLKHGPLPNKPVRVLGKVESIEWNEGKLSMRGPKSGLQSKENPPGKKDAGPEETELQHAVLDNELQVTFGTYRLPLNILGKGLQIQIAGYDSDEGVLLKQIQGPSPSTLTGTIQSVDLASKSLKMAVRKLSSSGFEESEKLIQMDFVQSVTLPQHQGKDVSEALKQLEPKQGLRVGCVERDGQLMAIWLVVSNPR